MTTTAAAPGRLPLAVWILAAGTFLMGTTEFLVAGLLPQIAGDLRVTVPQSGLLITVFAVGMIIGAPSMAIATLRLPPRVTLVLALALFAAAHVVVAVSGSFTVAVIARFVTAVATGAFWAVAAVVATRLAGPAAASKALAVALGGGMLANVIGVPIGSTAGQLLGWRGAFLGLAVLAVAAAVLIGATVPHEDPAGRSTSVRGEFSALRSGRLWLALSSCVFVTGGVLSVYSFIAPLLTDRTGLPNAAVPAALAVFGIGALVGTVLAARYGDRFPYVTVLSGAVLTLLGLIVLVPASTSPVATFLLLAALGVTGLSINPVLIVLAVRAAGSAPTLASALCTSAFNLGTAIGTAIAAPALAGLGPTGPLTVGIGSAALLLIPLLTLTALHRRQHTRRLEPAPA